MRLWALTFLGEPKERHKTAWSMWLPLVLLAAAVFALSIGKPFHPGVAAMSTGAALLGLGLGWLLRQRTFGRVLTNEFGYDRVFSRFVPAVAALQARFVVWADDTIVDSYPRGSTHTALGASWLMDRFQSAKAQLYATGIAIGAFALVGYAVIGVGR
jgi:NADH-quinone oxidoreductase subunit L